MRKEILSEKISRKIMYKGLILYIVTITVLGILNSISVIAFHSYNLAIISKDLFYIVIASFVGVYTPLIIPASSINFNKKSIRIIVAMIFRVILFCLGIFIVRATLW